MKNPFVKESNTGLWIAFGITGILAAVAAAVYFLKQPTVPQNDVHTQDYLKPGPVLHKKKTNLHDLHTIAAG